MLRHNDLSHLYPAQDDPFFTQPQSLTGTQQQQLRTTPQQNVSGGAGKHLEEHKVPEQQLQQSNIDNRMSLAGDWDVFGEMDRNFDAQMARMSRVMDQWTGGLSSQLTSGLGNIPKEGSSNYSYNSSSSSWSAGPDGNSKPYYRTVSESSSCVDGVSASRARYEDSLGNRREKQCWGLGQQQRELITDRNAKGEERTKENLKELQPADVSKFTQQWEQRRAQVDQNNRLLSGGNTNQAQLKNEPIRSIKSGENKDTKAGQKAVHA